MSAPANRNKFIDPAGNRAQYNWSVNHDEEDDFGKTRNIDHAANTGNTGLVRQQSDDSPMLIHVRGTILHRAQVLEMIAWWDLSEGQTVYFEDFTGDQFEVLITSFRPTRQRTIKNPRDFANAPYWIWKYELEMEVVKFLTPNIWSGVTP
jgi:hypothetical protein